MKRLFIIIIVFMIFPIININANQLESEVINAVLNPKILNEKLNKNTDETYHPLDRKFQRMATIIKTGKRIYASWTAGGDTEPHIDNYVVVAYSDDEEKTWVDPYLIIDPLDYQNGDKAQLPMFWINPDGLLFLFYSCNKSGYKYIVSSNSNEEDIKDVTWTEPRKSNSGGAYTKPTTLSNNTVLLTTQGSNPLVNPVYISYNKGTSWEILSYTNSSAGEAKRFNESQIVELSDGRLMYLARLEQSTSTGGVEIAYSIDKGLTWSTSIHSLDSPLRGCGSRMYFGKLQNGNLVFVTNNSKDSTRRNLTIYLSCDDGKTWPYSLLLDDRDPVSYPDLAETEDGKLAIIYDAGGNVGNNRYNLCEIRMAYISIEDIMAKEVISKGSFLKGIISKSDPGIEITEIINQSFEKELTFNQGFTKDNILALLPKTISFKTNDNNIHEYTGEWKTIDYNANILGRYTFEFVSDDLDKSIYQDNYSKLKVYVDIIEVKNDKKIILKVISLTIIGGLLVTFLIAIMTFKRKKKLI